MTTESLLSLLQTKRVSLESRGSASTGDVVRWTDVAGALTQVRDPVGRTLLLVKSGGGVLVTLSTITELRMLVVRRALIWAAEKRWRSKKEPIERVLGRLTDVALTEVIMPPPCQKCRGHGRRRMRGRETSMVCRRCKGRGWLYFSDRNRAQRAGIGAESWRLYWRKPYLKVFEYLQDSYRSAKSDFDHAVSSLSPSDE